MCEGETRQLASLYSIVADMEAVKTRREGMLADNADRTLRGVSLNYYEDSFQQVEEEFARLSERFKEEI